MTDTSKTTRYETGGFVPVVPGPLDTAAIWGASREQQLPDGARPHLSPGKPPWEPEGPRRPWHVLAIVAGLVLIVVAVFAIIAQRSDTLPQWVPLIGKDTGVAACQAIAEQGNLRKVASGEGVKGAAMNKAEYQEIRAIFADSRYPEIRDPGTQMADYAWQIQGLGEDAGLAALPLLMPMTQAYGALAGGCAQHGYVIPALGS